MVGATSSHPLSSRQSCLTIRATAPLSLPIIRGIHLIILPAWWRHTSTSIDSGTSKLLIALFRFAHLGLSCCLSRYKVEVSYIFSEFGTVGLGCGNVVPSWGVVRLKRRMKNTPHRPGMRCGARHPAVRPDGGYTPCNFYSPLSILDAC